MLFHPDPEASTLGPKCDENTLCPSPAASDVKGRPASSRRRPFVVSGKGNFLELGDGRSILDASGGAGVVSIGHGADEVVEAMVAQASQVSYVAWGFFDSPIHLKLASWLSETSGNHFTKAYICSSGSEAIEAAMKLAHEYFEWKGEPHRTNYIAREESYHGTTLGSLALGGHLGRRAPFEGLLTPNIQRVPACNEYRQRRPGETDEDFVRRKAEELETAFTRAGPHTVAAFVAEPVVGAASGCLTPVPGYFRAMKSVCERHGALLVLDEVMCGMGRTGTLHAWEQEGIGAPDIQTLGKGLGGGYQPVSAVLASRKIVDAMEAAGVTFNHGHTYQDHPIACAAALKVQQIIERDGLLANVKAQGKYLEKLLRARLGSHPHVGDIRGRGLFWGIEFVSDKTTKEPFDRSLDLAHRIHERALAEPYNMTMYYGQGCAGEGRGDHVMLMPAYNIAQEVVEMIVDKATRAIMDVFAELHSRQ